MAVIDPTAGAGTLGEGLHQEALPDFILVRSDEVDEGERLRPVDPVWAQVLGQMMARDGQDTPIQVCRLPGRNRWTLVVGAHRLAGARFADIEHLKAEVVTAERDARRMREVRENLWRSDLTPIDRAAFIAEAVAIHKRKAGLDPARSGGSLAADARWKKAISDEAYDANDTMSFAYGWSAKIAEQIGLTKRSIERDLMLYRRLPASLVERLRSARHPILSNASQLRALAKLDPDRQDLVVKTLVGKVVDGRTITSVAQAMALSGGAKAPAADPETKRLSAFIGAFSRMSLAEKKGALAQLSGMLPAGFALVEGEQRPAEATFSPHHELYREEALAAIAAMRELVDGLLEDEVVKDERFDALYRASCDLQIAHMTIAGNGFELGSPGSPVDAVAADLLGDAVGFIAEQLGKDMDADCIVGELTRRYAARSRFANGTYELKLGKVTSTCTSGGLNLLRAWVAKARARIAAAEGGDA